MSNQQVAKTSKDFFAMPNVKEKFTELLGKNAASFATSVLQIVNSNSMLKNADPLTVFNAACMAATLNLPINNNLGFAYIVPYKRNFQDADRQWQSVIEAQFQLGYKGFVQLAQRSGQFKTISASPVFDGQLVSENPLTGYEFNWAIKPDKNDLPVGYVAYFKLLNGFEAYLYMSIDEVKSHAGRYSETFKKNKGVWKDNFDAMALKTVLKLLLSKQAPLSIDMQKAVLADQAVVKDVDSEQFEYIDHTPEYTPVGMDLTNDDEMFQTVIKNIKSGELDKISVLSGEAGYTFSDEQKAVIVEA